MEMYVEKQKGIKITTNVQMDVLLQMTLRTANEALVMSLVERLEVSAQLEYIRLGLVHINSQIITIAGFQLLNSY